MSKSPDAFRTISEVADWLGVQAHVLRFWESKFAQVKPIKRAGGRRYYRPADMLLLGGIKKLLHDDGLTIKGVQKILREQGLPHVADQSQALDDLTIAVIQSNAGPEDAQDQQAASDRIIAEMTEQIAPPAEASEEHAEVAADETLPLAEPDDALAPRDDEQTTPPAEAAASEAIDELTSVENSAETAQPLELEEQVTAVAEAEPTADATPAVAPEPSLTEEPEIEALPEATEVEMEATAPAEDTPETSAAPETSAPLEEAEPEPEDTAPEEVGLTSEPAEAVTDEAEAPKIVEPSPDAVDTEAAGNTPPSFVRRARPPAAETTAPEDPSMAPAAPDLTAEQPAEPVESVDGPDPAAPERDPDDQTAEITPEHPETTPGHAPEEPRKPRVVEVKLPVAEAEMEVEPAVLSALSRLGDFDPAQREAIQPLLGELIRLRTAMDSAGKDAAKD